MAGATRRPLLLALVVGLASPVGTAQYSVFVYGGPVTCFTSPCPGEAGGFDGIGPGAATNTGFVGARPSIWDTAVAVATSEAEFGGDLDGVGGPPNSVVRILDLDDQAAVNTTLPISPDTGPSIASLGGFANGSETSLYVAWIAQEQSLFNVPFLYGPPPSACGPDVNQDGDCVDHVVVIYAYRNPVGTGNPVVGDTWILAPGPSSAGSFRSVHLSNNFMAVEQGIPGQPPLNPPSPILVFEMTGFANVVPNPATGGKSPVLVPLPALAEAGTNPKIVTGGPPFPFSGYLVFEQRESQFGDSPPADSDLCDRIVAVQQVEPGNPACPVPPACPQDDCPPCVGTVSPVMPHPACRITVGNAPDGKPDATYGNLISFDRLEPGLQPGVGPDCVPSSPDAGLRGRAQVGGVCAGSTGRLDLPGRWADQTSVSGRIYAHVVRESAANAQDINGDACLDPVVVWIDRQLGWPPPIPWTAAIGPGERPDTEHFFGFEATPLPLGTYLGLIVYQGDETLGCTRDLNYDGDENDRVLQVVLLQ